METKFTKGEWLIGVNGEITDDSAARNEIAFVEDWDQCPWVSDANRKLIASAPKLLETLLLARSHVGNQLIDVDGDGDNFKSVKEVIDEVLKNLELQ